MVSQVYRSQKINEDIADQFMPANRLISIAGRLAKAKVHRSNKTPEYTFPLHHQELIQWKREKNSLEYQEFKKLYKLSGEDFHTTQLCKIKDKFQELTKDIPSYIYLKENDEWIFVLFMILDLLLKHNSIINPHHFVQLCMLPHVLLATTSKLSKEYFCRAFHQVVSQLQPPLNLEEIMIRGIILSSLHELTFIYPIPSSSNNLTFPSQINFYTQSTSEYKNYWWQNFFKYTGNTDNPLLYFYLRNYINKMKFNPALISSWDGALNKPWDMDHIVPQSWWQQRFGEQHFAGNMQPLYFSDNRSKSDSCIGIDKQCNELRKILRYDEWDRDYIIGKDKKDCGLSGNEDYMRAVTFPRFKTMVSSIYEDLKLNELIESINKNIPTIEEPLTTDATTRYSLLCKVHKWLHEQYPHQKIKWGAVIYEWRQKQRSVRDTIMVPISDSENPPTFYESLTPWLSVGIETQDGYVCVCASGKTYEIGIRRSFKRTELDPQIRQKFSSETSDPHSWWYTCKKLIFKEYTLNQFFDLILTEMKKFSL